MLRQLFDPAFNGFDLLLIVLVIVGVLLARYAQRRADRARSHVVVDFKCYDHASPALAAAARQTDAYRYLLGERTPTTRAAADHYGLR